MSHFTQDPINLQVIEDYYTSNNKETNVEAEKVPTSCTLQKSMGDMSIYSELFTGSYMNAPVIGEPFRMTVFSNVYYRWFRTSPIKAIIETDTGYILQTLNSTYELKHLCLL